MAKEAKEEMTGPKRTNQVKSEDRAVLRADFTTKNQAAMEASENQGFVMNLVNAYAKRNPLLDAFVDRPEEKYKRAQMSLGNYKANLAMESGELGLENQQMTTEMNRRKMARLSGDEAFQDESRANVLTSQRQANELNAIKLKNAKYADVKTEQYNKVFDTISEANPNMNGTFIENTIMNNPAIKELVAFDTGVKQWMQYGGQPTDEFKSAVSELGGWYDEEMGHIVIPNTPEGRVSFPVDEESFKEVSQILYQRAAEQTKAMMQLENNKGNYAGIALNNIAEPIQNSYDEPDAVKGLKQANAFMGQFNGGQKRNHYLSIGIGQFLEDGTITEDEMGQLQFLGKSQGFSQIQDENGAIFIIKDNDKDSKAIPIKDFHEALKRNDTIAQRTDTFLASHELQRVNEKMANLKVVMEKNGVDFSDLDNKTTATYIQTNDFAQLKADEVLKTTQNIQNADQVFKKIMSKFEVPKKYRYNPYAGFKLDKELQGLKKKLTAQTERGFEEKSKIAERKSKPYEYNAYRSLQSLSQDRLPDGAIDPFGTAKATVANIRSVEKEKREMNKGMSKERRAKIKSMTSKKKASKTKK